MDWLTLLYQSIGSKHPIISLIVVSAIGAILSGGAWWLIGQKYENGLAKQNAPASPTIVHTGPATTSGDNSPANTGSGNSTTYQTPAASGGKQ